MTEEECLASGCALVQLPNRTHIELRGSDRAEFLHNLCTNDIKRLQFGQGCEAFITNVQGKTIGHVLAFLGDNILSLETVPNQATTLMAHLDKYLITEDVQLDDQTDVAAEIAVLGRTSQEVLKQAGLDAPTEAYDHRDCILGGHAVSVRRVSMTAVPNFLLRSTTNGMPDITASLSSVGAVPQSPNLLETARIEYGWPQFGQDFTADNLPQELNRDTTAISFTKGCYLGQETVARIDALGHVNRIFVGLRIDGAKVPAEGDKLSVEGKPIGKVTSATFSSRLSAPLALGIVRTAHAEPGTQIDCDGLTATVIDMPIE